MDETVEPYNGFQLQHSNKLVLLRLVIALIQGFGLYFLSLSTHAGTLIPPSVSQPLYFIFSFIPIILQLNIDKLSIRSLTYYCLGVSLFIIIVNVYYLQTQEYAATLLPTDPTSGLWPMLILALFVTNPLVVSASIERKTFPSYVSQFDIAWKQTIIGLLTNVFVGLLWGIIFLGVALFSLVGIHSFSWVVLQGWFANPATTLAIAASIHLTNLQPKILRSIQVLILTLFSSLLPLTVIIVLGFLLRLCATSFAPLWTLEYPTALLLGTSALLVFLINCTYQSGQDYTQVRKVKRWAVSVAIFELAPVVFISAWALFQRVQLYGWTVHRIFVCAATLFALCYAIGYNRGYFRRHRVVESIESANIFAAYVFLALCIALFTPLADPSRIMVADQILRLYAQRIVPASFDYQLLASEGKSWGHDALQKLSTTYTGPEAPFVKSQAAVALNPPFTSPSTQQAKTLFLTVYPTNQAVDSTFKNNAEKLAPDCYSNLNGECLALQNRDNSHRVTSLFITKQYDDKVLYLENSPHQGWRLVHVFLFSLRTGSECHDKLISALKTGRIFTTTKTLPVIKTGNLTLYAADGDHIDDTCTP